MLEESETKCVKVGGGVGGGRVGGERERESAERLTERHRTAGSVFVCTTSSLCSEIAIERT